MGGWVVEENTRIRLSLAQFHMKLPAGAEIGNSSHSGKLSQAHF